MKTIALRLEGPLQCWATQSKHGVRLAGSEPSKSGVLGLVAAALGMPREDDATLSELAALWMAVRVDRPGSIVRDFHTAGGGTFRGDPKYSLAGTGNAVTSQRYYLQNASFVAYLGGDPPLIDRIASAVQDPRWPPFLGRRSCVPSKPIFDAVLDGPPDDALRSVPPADRVVGPLRAVVECAPGEGEPRSDVPVSLVSSARLYGRRFVRTRWVEFPEEVVS